MNNSNNPIHDAFYKICFRKLETIVFTNIFHMYNTAEQNNSRNINLLL